MFSWANQFVRHLCAIENIASSKYGGWYVASYAQIHNKSVWLLACSLEYNNVALIFLKQVAIFLWVGIKLGEDDVTASVILKCVGCFNFDENEEWSKF